MAVLAALVESLAVFINSEYCWLLRLSTWASVTIRLCLRPVIGTVEVVPHAAKSNVATTDIRINLKLNLKCLISLNLYITYIFCKDKKIRHSIILFKRF